MRKNKDSFNNDEENKIKNNKKRHKKMTPYKREKIKYE